jgi:AraC-like DNA-binding protein
MASPAPGEARAVSIGDARLWLIRCPAGKISRKPDPKSPRDLFVSIVLEGSNTIARDGRVFQIDTGHLYIGRVSPDGAEMSSEAPSSFLLLEVPSAYVTTRYPQLERLSFHVCSKDAPGAAMLRDLLWGAIHVGERLEARQRRIALAAIIELLILPLSGVLPEAPQIVRVDRVMAQIDDQLADPRLNAASLAREQGISRRRLDELFVSALGSPVAAWIAVRRLTRASELLRDASSHGLSVASIALRVGFREATHFSRAFKARFGMTPKEWRDSRS